MIIKIQVIRNDKVVSEVTKEITDSILPLKRERQNNLEIMIADMLPKIVEDTVKDYDQEELNK